MVRADEQRVEAEDEGHHRHRLKPARRECGNRLGEGDVDQLAGQPGDGGVAAPLRRPLRYSDSQNPPIAAYRPSPQSTGDKVSAQSA